MKGIDVKSFYWDCVVPRAESVISDMNRRGDYIAGKFNAVLEYYDNELYPRACDYLHDSSLAKDMKYLVNSTLDLFGFDRDDW